MPSVNALPLPCEPVSMSCVFGLSPRPLTTAPFSVNELSLPSLLLAPCKSSTLAATCTPFALNHGPLPIRSRALTAGWPFAALALRYACQVFEPSPAVAASFWHSASAPVSPPSLAPSPGPALVMKKLMLVFCALAKTAQSAAIATQPTATDGGCAANAGRSLQPIHDSENLMGPPRFGCARAHPGGAPGQSNRTGARPVYPLMRCSASTTRSSVQVVIRRQTGGSPPHARVTMIDVEERGAGRDVPRVMLPVCVRYTEYRFAVSMSRYTELP